MTLKKELKQFFNYYMILNILITIADFNFKPCNTRKYFSLTTSD